MKAQELNGTHLGRLITVTENGNSATGKLSKIEHQGNIINDQSFGGDSFESLGATWVHLEFFANVNVTTTTAAEVTLL